MKKKITIALLMLSASALLSSCGEDCQTNDISWGGSTESVTTCGSGADSYVKPQGY